MRITFATYFEKHNTIKNNKQKLKRFCLFGFNIIFTTSNYTNDDTNYENGNLKNEREEIISQKFHDLRFLAQIVIYRNQMNRNENMFYGCQFVILKATKNVIKR